MSNLQPTAFSHSGADLSREIRLPEGVQLAQYSNGNEHVFYENDSQHTLSLYLTGGYNTHRTDEQGPNGAPGRFSLMPKDSYSAWDIGEPQQFVHLYFDDDYLKRIALTTLDLDPRKVQLPQVTFQESKGLDALFRHALLSWDWQQAESMLALEQATQTLLVHMLHGLGIAKLSGPRLTAGLSPKVKHRVVEYLHANFSHQISLKELADLAELSEFHFSRMFKISLVQTPQQYITRLRVEQAKKLLAKPRPVLAEVALLCGFANQSHLGRFFKQYTGLTPGQYAKYVSA